MSAKIAEEQNIGIELSVVRLKERLHSRQEVWVWLNLWLLRLSANKKSQERERERKRIAGKKKRKGIRHVAGDGLIIGPSLSE